MGLIFILNLSAFKGGALSLRTGYKPLYQNFLRFDHWWRFFFFAYSTRGYVETCCIIISTNIYGRRLPYLGIPCLDIGTLWVFSRSTFPQDTPCFGSLSCKFVVSSRKDHCQSTLRRYTKIYLCSCIRPIYKTSHLQSISLDKPLMIGAFGQFVISLSGRLTSQSGWR